MWIFLTALVVQASFCQFPVIFQGELFHVWIYFWCVHGGICSWLMSSYPTILYKVIIDSESVSEVTQSCPTPCDPMDYSLPGSSLHGILQARVLEWVTISFSRDWGFVFVVLFFPFTLFLSDLLSLVLCLNLFSPFLCIYHRFLVCAYHEISFR